MKRKLLGSSVVALWLVAGPALAEKARGMLTKIDLNSHELTLRGKGKGTGKGQLQFKLGDKVRVIAGGEKGTLKDLQTGRRVRVEYEDQDGQRVITSIRMFGSKGGGGRPILGRVLDISREDGEMTVRGKLAKGEPRREITLRLPKDVKVTRAGRPFRLQDVTEGTIVRIMHRKHDGKRTVEAIQVIDPEALITRMRDAMKKADGYLNMAEFYLKMREATKAKRKTNTQPQNEEE